MSIKIIVNGANGKMGQEAVKAITNSSDLVLVAQTGRRDNLAKVVSQTQAQVVVDFTTADAAFENTCYIIEANARPVIGTSGLTAEQIADLALRCQQQRLGGIIAPNFALGAVLMMRYARDCAQYFPDVEIIEMHHAQKADAPSGTAIRTAEMISEQRASGAAITASIERFKGVLGGRYQDIPIHSIRLPGLIAHESIIFGGLGQSLTLQHDTYNREAFMPGVCLACRKVMELDRLVYGLENVL